MWSDADSRIHTHIAIAAYKHRWTQTLRCTHSFISTHTVTWHRYTHPSPWPCRHKAFTHTHTHLLTASHINLNTNLLIFTDTPSLTTTTCLHIQIKTHCTLPRCRYMYSYTQLCVCWETHTQGQTFSINLLDTHFHSHAPMVLHTHWDNGHILQTHLYVQTHSYTQNLLILSHIHADADNVANMHIETTLFTPADRHRLSPTHGHTW